MTYNKQVALLKSQIENLQNQIKVIQSKCPHKDVTKKHGSNTGHLCEQDDSYWTDFSCPNCCKTWTEYSK
jgi:hypothetical protein